MRLDASFTVFAVCLASAVACSSSSSTGGDSDAGSSSSSGGSSSSSGSASGSGSGSGSSSGGSQCPSGETPCAAQCCPSTSVCTTDAAGNKACALRCATSSDCPAAAGCCNNIEGTGACVDPASVVNPQCLCKTEVECSAQGHTGANSTCCAPLADANGFPTGPYVCKGGTTANDGKPYDCGYGSCTAGYCLLKDGTSGSSVCMLPCTTTAQCGTSGATCSTITMGGTCNSATGACIAP